MMAEYAAVYGGPPAATAKWMLFLALAGRVSQFWSRRQLVEFDAVRDSVGTMFGEPGVGERIRESLERRAWPVSKRSQPRVIQNRFAEPADTGADT